MAHSFLPVAEFKGFSVSYDENTNPYFLSIVLENLREIAKVALGAELLKLIASAKPASRADFPIGINVNLCPHNELRYVQSGYTSMMGRLYDSPNDPRTIGPKGCRHYLMKSSFNAGRDPKSISNGTGSVCDLHFNNAQFITTKGDYVRSYVVLFHELVHSYHCLLGITKEEHEEEWTTGIGVYSEEKISENAFRKQAGIPVRTSY